MIYNWNVKKTPGHHLCKKKLKLTIPELLLINAFMTSKFLLLFVIIK